MILQRTSSYHDGILGVLYTNELDQVCVTLEHSYNNMPKLPPGYYICQKGFHSLHSHPIPFQTFEVMGVPGHTGILFHWGNYNRDSDGCILVGRVHTSNHEGHMITDSRDTFTHWMLDMEPIQTFTLTVKG